MSKEYYSDFTGQKYSKNAFIDVLTKRIKKDLRINNPLDIKKNYYLEENSPITKIIANLIEEIFEKRLNLIIIPKKETLLVDLIKLDDSYLEKYVANKTKVFFDNKEIDDLKKVDIPIIRTITFEEIKQLKEIYEIEGNIEKETLEFVEDLNKEYIQTKSSFLKSFNHIEKLLK